MGITAAVVSAVGVGVGYTQAKKQAKQQKRAMAAQEKANRVQTKVESIRANRERRQNIARARVLQAQQVAGGFGAGVGSGSSAPQGTFGGIGSTAAGNVGMSNTMQAGAGAISALNMQRDTALNKANTAGQYSQLGFSIFQMAAPTAFGSMSFGNAPTTGSSPAPQPNAMGNMWKS